jgi:hypothetical protein
VLGKAQASRKPEAERQDFRKGEGTRLAVLSRKEALAGLSGGDDAPPSRPASEKTVLQEKLDVIGAINSSAGV